MRADDGGGNDKEDGKEDCGEVRDKADEMDGWLSGMGRSDWLPTPKHGRLSRAAIRLSGRTRGERRPRLFLLHHSPSLPPPSSLFLFGGWLHGLFSLHLKRVLPPAVQRLQTATINLSRTLLPVPVSELPQFLKYGAYPPSPSAFRSPLGLRDLWPRLIRRKS